jgi:hypothetical protein
MLKIFVGFVIFAGLAMFVITHQLHRQTLLLPSNFSLLR